ncbi:phospholipid phosphatase [Solibacillus sp. FSL H8-0523]|uniref:phospholipid phosphatase n=1 Tax=Solibacillus sp. FSL H8-0523 TaxID=2954511 RepID=UPI003100B294
MDPYIFGLFAIAYLAVFIWGIVKHKKTASAVLFLVVLALIYDNGILALGHVIGEGELLETLSAARFWLHGVFTPTLILFSYFVLREANIGFAKKTWVGAAFIVLMVAAWVIEFMVELKDLTLGVQESYGVASYSSVEAISGPPPMILIVVLALLVTAIFLAWKRKWWWMLVGVIIMTIGSAVTIDVGSDAITNLFELILIVTLMHTAIRFSNVTDRKMW